MEHACLSAVLLSVDAEVETYDNQAAAANNQFCYKYREEPSRKPCDYQHRLVKLARSDSGY